MPIQQPGLPKDQNIKKPLDQNKTEQSKLNKDKDAFGKVKGVENKDKNLRDKY